MHHNTAVLDCWQTTHSGVTHCALTTSGLIAVTLMAMAICFGLLVIYAAVIAE